MSYQMQDQIVHKNPLALYYQKKKRDKQQVGEFTVLEANFLLV